MFFLFSLFSLSFVISFVECKLSSKTIHDLFYKHGLSKKYNLTKTNYGTQAIMCSETTFNLKFWEHNSALNFDLIGNWTGEGRLQFRNENTMAVLLDTHVNDTWNIIFDDGHIQWTDTFRPDIVPNNPSDIFLRYLQPGFGNSWSTCTNTTASSTPDGVGFELIPFGLTTQYSALINVNTGVLDADCTYNFETNDIVRVSCIYYDSLSNIPTGTVMTYALHMIRDT